MINATGRGEPGALRLSSGYSLLDNNGKGALKHWTNGSEACNVVFELQMALAACDSHNCRCLEGRGLALLGGKATLQAQMVLAPFNHHQKSDKIG